ncbi:MAG: DMT family transporter [Acidimicrobiales bacterium]
MSSISTTSEPRSDLSQGLLGAGIAVTAWSAGSVLAKGIDMPGLSLGVYRFAIFAVIMVAWMQFKGRPMRWEVMRYATPGGIALGVNVALFYSAVKLTNVVNATLIGALQPVLVGMVAIAFFGEKIRKTDIIWSAIALAGVIAVVLASNSTPEWSAKGDLLSACAMVMWSMYFIASKSSKKHLTPLEFTAGTSIWAALICLPLAITFGQDLSFPSARSWLGLAAMTVVAGIVGHVLMNWSLVRIPLWVGSTFTLFIPVSAALMAWIFLDEALSIAQMTPVLVVIAALAAIVRGQSKSVSTAE